MSKLEAMHGLRTFDFDCLLWLRVNKKFWELSGGFVEQIESKFYVGNNFIFYFTGVPCKIKGGGGGGG